ncbi:MAG: hypothetical protein GYB67_08280 [Chloroflexi bacterium]|nr:hypothetical protein [Chloroflexota bacterium]
MTLMRRRPRPTYRQYAQRTLGHPASEWAAIRSMFRRAFRSPTFAGFWRYWNPLFAYYLYYLCYRPLAQWLPRPPAVLITFALSGAIHDVFASLVTRRVFVLFTPVFAVYGLWVILEEYFGLTLTWAPVWLRATAHTITLLGTLGVGLLIRRAVA